MALVRVGWSETVNYEAQIEIDGYDPEQDPNDEESDVMDAILNLDKEAFDKAFEGVEEREIGSVEIVRAGDDTPEIKAAKPAYREDF